MSKTAVFATVNIGSVHCRITWPYKFDISGELNRICSAEFRLGNKGHVVGLSGCIASALRSFTVVQWEAYTAARGYVWYLWWARGLCFEER